MKTLVSDGQVLKLTAPTGGVVSGQGYMIGGLFVVALVTVDAGVEFTAHTKGVYALPKESSSVTFAEGDACYWDVADAEFNDSASGNYLVAVCVKAAVAGDTTVDVKLLDTYVAAGA